MAANGKHVISKSGGSAQEWLTGLFRLLTAILSWMLGQKKLSPGIFDIFSFIQIQAAGFTLYQDNENNCMIVNKHHNQKHFYLRGSMEQ